MFYVLAQASCIPRLLQHRGVSLASYSTSSPTMPPRRSAHLRNVMVGPSDVHESMASRRQRLYPVAPRLVDDDDAPLWPPAPTVSTRTSPYTRTAADLVRRPDMPTVRNVRRGSAAEALRAFRELGAEALVE